MKTSSAKAKGRNLCKTVKSIILEWLKLSENDIEVTSSGANGMDLKLSPEARKQFPYAVEAKNQESISIWASWKQCQTNAILEKLKPLLIIKRNHSDILVVMGITDLMELLYVKNKKAEATKEKESDS